MADRSFLDWPFLAPEHKAHALALDDWAGGLGPVDHHDTDAACRDLVARLGADVVGADASETNIEVAKIHAEQSGLAIDYRATTSENLQAAGETFDVVLNMEVVEHVSDVDLYMKSCAAMVRPGGLMFVATINRTLKAYGLAIIGAEHILRWLPRGTHQYEKLVTPAELDAALQETGVQITRRSGVSYNPIADQWRLSRDMDVNYMVVAERPNG